MSCGCGSENRNCCTDEFAPLVCYECGKDIEKGKEAKRENKIYCKSCGELLREKRK